MVGGALVVVAVAASGGGGDDQGLTIERIGAVGGGGPEIVLYVNDRSSNTLSTTGGKRVVTVECLSKGGKPLLQVPTDWPFGFPDGRNLDPHVHQPVDARVAPQLARCRLKGTKPLLEGEIGGPKIR